MNTPLTCEIALLTILDSAKIPITLTAIQKIAFLAEKAKLINTHFYTTFHGPSSNDIHNTLINLLAVGWIFESKKILDGESLNHYQITPTGLSALKKLAPQNTQTLKEFHNLVKTCWQFTRFNPWLLIHLSKTIQQSTINIENTKQLIQKISNLTFPNPKLTPA
jgi:uncharacterized protein YwgA